ncbi:hypothetical protein BKA14_001737 [Actinoplanes abujensis]|uniref:Uncharacterized protein n=1 Tax=Paractinoplanes abujensis TaxID=882441 RepID=A0A7W7CN14_9ACTN|nr:hypothetical protein [Actinoplanes abujensis]
MANGTGAYPRQEASFPCTTSERAGIREDPGPLPCDVP